MTKILITGGGGYIGSVLTPTLLNKGYKVIVLDNFLHRQHSLLDCCHDPNLEIIRGDCRDEKSIRKLVNKLDNEDFILPLAAYVGAPLCDKFPLESQSVNVDAIRMLLKFRSAETKNLNIIFPCTNSGYGLGQKDKEGKAIYCNEQTPLNPISLYGRQKVESEKIILESGDAISLRLATVMGVSPFMRLDLLVNSFVWKSITDKYIVLFESHFKRNYINIKDVTKAFIHCINNWKHMKDNIYNVGLSDANLSKFELCQEIQKQIPDFYFTEAKVGEDQDKRDYIVDNSKLENTGWKADYSLQATINELIKAYQVIKD